MPAPDFARARWRVNWLSSPGPRGPALDGPFARRIQHPTNRAFEKVPLGTILMMQLDNKDELKIIIASPYQNAVCLRGRAGLLMPPHELNDQHRSSIVMRYWIRVKVLATLPILASGIVHAACLTTLGTDDCFRAGDPRVQAIEHRYLDIPRRYHSRAPRRVRILHPDLLVYGRKRPTVDQVLPRA